MSYQKFNTTIQINDGLKEAFIGVLYTGDTNKAYAHTFAMCLVRTHEPIKLVGSITLDVTMNSTASTPGKGNYSLELVPEDTHTFGDFDVRYQSPLSDYIMPDVDGTFDFNRQPINNTSVINFSINIPVGSFYVVLTHWGTGFGYAPSTITTALPNNLSLAVTSVTKPVNLGLLFGV